VTFDGKATNLHAVWDTSVPEKLVGGYSLELAQGWATDLTQAISSGTYKDQAAAWLDGMSLDDPVSTTMVWAKEANQFVCSTVMPNGADALEGQELDGDYYDTAVPVVQLQIAKAGYRYVQSVYC
jgi:S1/P1 Nuclease